MNSFIPVNEPVLNKNAKKYLEECIDTGWISSEGPFVVQFEKGMAERADRKYGIAVCNGTVALEVAVAALDLPRGSEIIMPAFTIISCASAIVKSGCVPVLVDCDELTWNMDVKKIEEKITERTKAIMVVHIYGLPVDMNPVIEIAERYDLKIVEDAAEMHGQDYYGKPCGSFGDVSTFSFYTNKHVTTGEGGMILTDNEQLAERCRSLRNLCFVKERRFIHYELGNNYRMSNLQAAVGLAQLEKLDDFIEKKRKIGKLYLDELNDLKGIQNPLPSQEYANNIYWVYGVVLDDDLPVDAVGMMGLLAERGIGTRPFFWPMHEQPVFHKMGLFLNEKYPNAERIARRGFYLPSGLALTDEEIKIITNTLKNVIEELS